MTLNKQVLFGPTDPQICCYWAKVYFQGLGIYLTSSKFCDSHGSFEWHSLFTSHLNPG